MSDLAGRHLLVVGGGREALPGLARLRALGARLAVSDRDPRAPGLALADERLLASTYDADATVAAARALHAHRPLDGVLCIAADVPLTVARVAEALGLAGLPVAAARRVADKLAMKEALRAGGVPVPEFAPVGSTRDLRAALRRLGLPAIAKPADGRGARGVVRIRPGDDPAAAFAAARDASPSGRVLVERFVAGPQLSSESFLVGAAVATPGLADRNYEWLDACAPHVIENGGLQPARDAAALAPRVDALVVAAARALGIASGVVKGDLVVDAVTGELLVIEVAARLSGGSFCTLTIPHSTGVDLVAAVARHAVGLPVAPAALRPSRMRPVANRYFRPPAGRLRAVHGLAEAARMPGVVFVDLAIAPGDEIRPLTDHACRVGSVIAVADDPDLAIARAEAAVAAVRFDVDPAGVPARPEDSHEALPRHRLAG
jgi:biotin carboxylase